MEAVRDLPVNDGGGLMDNIGLIDSLIVDCNNATKALVCGNYIQHASIMVNMVKKLSNLKAGVKNDTEGLMKQIEDLKNLLGVERGQENAAGSVYNPLDGTMEGREESLRDVITAEGGGLEPDTDHAGT